MFVSCLRFGPSALGGNEHKSPATDGRKLSAGISRTRYTVFYLPCRALPNVPAV